MEEEREAAAAGGKHRARVASRVGNVLPPATPPGLVDALRPAWYTRGRRNEELRIYTWAKEAADALGDLDWRRWAVHHLAVTQSEIEHIDEARQDYRQALELARQMGSLEKEMVEMNCLAVLDSQTGRLGEARQGYEQSLVLARQLNDLAQERRELHVLAVLDSQMRRLDKAKQGYEQALELARQLQDQEAEAEELRNPGFFLCWRGEPKQGRPMIEESLVICERLGDVSKIGRCHEFLGAVDA